MRKQGESLKSKRRGYEDRIRSNPHGLVQPCSAWAVLCGSIFEPWSYLCVPPSLILSTWTSCCDGPCVTTLLHCCLAPHQLSSAHPCNSSSKLLATSSGGFLSAFQSLTQSPSNPMQFFQLFPHTLFTFNIFFRAVTVSWWDPWVCQ